MTSSFKALFLTTATLSLLACSAEDAGQAASDVANVETALETVKDGMARKMIDYKDAGKTDADHLYLEEVLGEQALGEVKAWNTRSLARLESDPRFIAMQAEALAILNSKDKIPYVSYQKGRAQNFWQDADHVRGVWRRTNLDSYLGENTDWETVLNFDDLSKSEDANWVYKGRSCLPSEPTRCIVNLSDGGKDAVVRREFDAATKTWVEGGFVTPESKGAMSWLDKDHMLVGVDFGEGTMTDSGYSMVTKLWTRGTPLEDAVEIMRGAKEDVGVWPGTLEVAPGQYEIIIGRSLTFYESEYFWLPRDGASVSKPVKMPVPLKSNMGGRFKTQVLLSLQQDWRGYKSGDLVSFSPTDFMENGEIDKVHLVFSPNKKQSMNGYGITKSKVLMSISEDVSSSAFAFDWDGENWTSKKLDFPENGSVSIGATDDEEDIAFISTESFLTPDTLWTYNTKTSQKQPAKSLPSWFDANSMVAEQFFANSTDGTKVPYFVVRGKDVQMDGMNPTLLYGYGGFEISLNPSYSATRGKLWMERGGIYVLANIRGGGEYGPNWHQAGLKTDRQRIYDDFISVAEDLIAKDITRPKHLGIEGGSNGGLLMGVMATQRPDLFNAVVCAVPLLDMMRYHTLLAGASWMGEYGDPDDAVEGKFLRSISPYHNVDPEADYPEIFFVTSTKDDRVHPAHARKMAKRMEDYGHDFLYYENIDGGHSAAANLKETARRLALQHTYLFQKLKDGE
ncbi:MAG: prolyl oligopeptidase family serine peptidase [Maricaulaceae bacterium]